MFAAIFVTVRGIQDEVNDKEADGGFTFSDLFKNTLFFTLIVSLLSTYVLWIVVSLLFLDPWHMVTSVSPFLLPLLDHYCSLINDPHM